MNSKQLSDKYGMKKQLFFALQRFTRNVPGLGSCGLCGRTWNTCKWHDTVFMEGQSCFPLCEECWSVLSPAERLPYYKALLDRWKAENDRKKSFVEEDEYYEVAWEGMKKSVEAGL